MNGHRTILQAEAHLAGEWTSSHATGVARHSVCSVQCSCGACLFVCLFVCLACSVRSPCTSDHGQILSHSFDSAAVVPADEVDWDSEIEVSDCGNSDFEHCHKPLTVDVDSPPLVFGVSQDISLAFSSSDLHNGQNIRGLSDGLQSWPSEGVTLKRCLSGKKCKSKKNIIRHRKTADGCFPQAPATTCILHSQNVGVLPRCSR